jgi:hypothetical protein
MATIFVGTRKGLLRLSPAGDRGETLHPGESVTALAPGEEGLWAVVDGREIRRTDGSGATAHVATTENGRRANCLAETRAGVLAGTSEAHLMRLDGGGLTSVEPFEGVEGRDGWYTPWGGPPDVRSLAEDDGVLYANVHVGGIPRSTDGGASWEPTIDVDADVHRVSARDGVVLAACARGLAMSGDRGRSWDMRTDGLHATYCRAVAVQDDTVFVSASVGPHGGRSAVYRGALAGGPLERCRDGLPDWFGDNIDSACLDAGSGLVAFGTSDGKVFSSADGGSSWGEIVAVQAPVRCLLVAP